MQQDKQRMYMYIYIYVYVYIYIYKSIIYIYVYVFFFPGHLRLAGNLIDLPISTPPKISHLGRYAAPELPSRHELHVEIFHCIASESWSGNIGDSTRVVSLLLLVGWFGSPISHRNA